MPVLTKPKSKSAKPAAEKVFDPANETIVTYDGKQVSVLYETAKVRGKRFFKIRTGTIDKVVPASELSPYVPRLRTEYGSWDFSIAPSSLRVHVPFYNK